MAPGSCVHHTVSVANRGERAGMLSIGVAVTGQPAGGATGLADALQVSITDAAGRLLARGTLRGFGNQALERIPAGAARSVTVSVALPATSGASGGRVSADIVWTLTEAQ
jgi:hypothetical protein